MDSLNTYTRTLKKHYSKVMKNFDYDVPEVVFYSKEDIDEMSFSEIYQNKCKSLVMYEDELTIINTIIKNKCKPLLVIRNNLSNPIELVKNGGASNLIYYCSNLLTWFRNNTNSIKIMEEGITVFDNVVIYKDSNFSDVRPHNVSVAMINTPIKPNIIFQDYDYIYQYDYDKHKMENAIDMILSYAESNDYDIVIFDDLGCVKDDNPYLDVVNILNDIVPNHSVKGIVYSIRLPMSSVYLQKTKHVKGDIFKYFDSHIDKN